MKVTVAPAALLEGLNIASAAAATRTPKASLQCVLLQAANDQLMLMATDLEVGVRFGITQVDIESDGEVLVPAAKLQQIIRECSDDTIVLELVEDVLHIKASDSHFQVFTSDTKEFPPVPVLEGKADFQIGGQELKRMIDLTLFAAARESTRYAIDGLLWDYQEGAFKMIATDGRRLAVAGAPVERAGAQSGRAIVPSKAVALFGRVILSPDEVFEIKFLSNQVLLKSERVSCSSILLEGHFPKYEDVIPNDCDKRVDVKVDDMLSAVKRAALLTSEESKGIRLSFSDNKVLMSSRAPEQGQATVELPIAYEDEPLEIGFNPNFLADVLKVVNGETVTLEVKESHRPGVFRDGQDYLYVVMPVNLS